MQTGSEQNEDKGGSDVNTSESDNHGAEAYTETETSNVDIDFDNVFTGDHHPKSVPIQPSLNKSIVSSNTKTTGSSCDVANTGDTQEPGNRDSQTQHMQQTEGHENLYLSDLKANLKVQ